ncbi:ATP-binding protein [Paenibacillus xanthanilyticus]|uniref:ATP-binding protein n=1 Tax=Paenibacillus xanthanilyticus TaxID=1783531 RepID=A0ABV8JW27_9BACL
MPAQELHHSTFNNTDDLTCVRESLSKLARDLFDDLGGLVEIALSEALQNAVNYGDRNTIVTVRAALVNHRRLVVRIKSIGPGFDAEAYLQKANRFEWVEEEFKESGRGLMIICSVFDRVRFNKKGTDFLLIKAIPNAKKIVHTAVKNSE